MNINRLAIFLFAITFTVLPNAARAEETAVFNFVHQNESFEVDTATLSAWQGKTVLPTSNLLTLSVTAANPVALYFGQQSRPSTTRASYNFRPDKIYAFIAKLAEKIEQKPQEPVLEIINNRAVKFTPPKNGKNLDAYASTLWALAALNNRDQKVELTVYEQSPRKKLSELNNLGINELLAEGKSSFKGSPKNRRHNITVGVEKMKGIILAPGEEFSFNKFLGPVEKEEGFLPELVIKRTGTVPELGGGLCQVSSTTFRAAMNAGLPIVQRKNHAYAVQYYSPQGTDATIYPGVVDLKFKNDTLANLLIWPSFPDKDTLVFDFYGTKDQRVVDVKKPIQYDRKEDGSLKAEWTRVVLKDGVTSTSTFKSVYQPPALFHKEEEFVTSASPAPTPTPAPLTVN